MLTLLVVPVIYTWMDGLTRFVKRLFARAQHAPALGSDVT
jgi:hypothetical protein